MAPDLIPRFTTLEDVEKYLSDELEKLFKLTKPDIKVIILQSDANLKIIFCEPGTLRDLQIRCITEEKQIPGIAAEILKAQQEGTMVPYIM